MTRKVLGACGALVLLALAVALMPQRGKASDIDSVLVVNGPKKPVPVSLAAGATLVTTNGDARQPVQVDLNLTGDFSDTPAFTVPPGKRFVLEDLSGVGEVPAGEKILHIGADFGPKSEIVVPTPFEGTLSGSDFFAGGRLARAFAEPGTVVTVFGLRSGMAGGALDVHVRGYFIDL